MKHINAAKKFGKLLRSYREKCFDEKQGKRISQHRLSELISIKSGLEINRNKVGEWERGLKMIDHQDRMLLVALLFYLYKYKGIETLDNANHLLRIGLYHPLDEQEITKINPEWLAKKAEDEVSGKLPKSIDSLADSQLPKNRDTFQFKWKKEEGLAVDIIGPVIIDLLDKSRPGSAPPVPSLFIGRENDLENLKNLLKSAKGKENENTVQVLTAIRGWPGVGKTTIASAIAHDPEISSKFPDGILWVSLGQDPSLLSEIAAWGRALGTNELLHARTLEEASAQLRAMLRHRQALLIIDDVWESEHAVPFNVGGRGCATLITTRLGEVADALAPTPENVYLLSVLTDEKAIELLKRLAPSAISKHPDEALALAQKLEGLPLALQVAGRLLNTEAGYGFGLLELIAELQEGVKLLEATAPPDRADIVKETTPTIAVLLHKSFDRLDKITKDCYAYLGVFAPKPATFDLDAMKAVWEVANPKPIARTLVDRGLLEYVSEIGLYQMHAVLVMHAKSFLTD